MSSVPENPPSRRGRAVTLVVELCVNFVLPYLIYVQTQAKIGEVDALLVSSLPPIVWSIVEFIRKRRIDALSMMVIAGILLSLLAFAGGGSVQFLQLRENLVTGVIGLAFLGSAVIGKPLIYPLARAGMARKSAAQANDFEKLRGHAYFEATIMIMTWVWGVGLLAETIIACILVFMLPVATYLLISPILGYGVMGALALWTFLYTRRRKRIGAERRAAGIYQ